MLFLVKFRDEYESEHAMQLNEKDLRDLADELTGYRDQPENIAQAITILENLEYDVEQVY